MKHIYRLLLLLVLSLPFLVKAQNLRTAEPNKLVFKLKPSAAGALARSAGNSPLQQTLKKVAKLPARQKFPRAMPDATTRASKKNAVDLSLIYELDFLPNQSLVQIKKQLLATGLVDYVEPLYRYDPLYIPNDPKADPETGSQEYLKRIMAYEGWDISKGDTNVVIGIIDTGVRYTHEDLIGNLKYNYDDLIDGIDNDGDGYVDNFRGWDMADNDNNPIADANGHGTLVTGVAAASTDNGLGIAGVGFKCKFLPVKVYASTEEGSFRGYEGIVYAADHGCQIINLSWGGAGFPSAFEQDVVNYASINRNVVIVAAAGNTNQDLDFYPASYQNVLSVGSVTREDVKTPSHTFSYAIKIVAQGANVFTTGNNSDTHYGHGNGSSYAAPMVSGAAALVRSHFPTLTAAQIVERLRVTADDIYTLPGNVDYQEKLGKGRLNVARALAEQAPKSARLLLWEFLTGASGKPGDELVMRGTFKNFLSPVSNLTVTVTSVTPYLEVTQGQFTAGSMGTLELKANENVPFKFKVAQNTPYNSQAILRFGFSDGNYTDYQYIKFNLNPDFVTTDVNHVVTSVLSRGNVAYEGLNAQIGHGFSYWSSDPLLAEGGLLVGYSPTLVSDNIRNEKGRTDNDFYALSTIVRKPNSTVAEFEATNVMQDSLTSTKTKSTTIRQNVYAWSDVPNQDFVILEYVLQNRTNQPITQAYAGMFADWDLVAASANVTEYNPQLKLGFIRHISDTSVWTGIQVLSKGAPGFYALENSNIREGVINIGDGFTTAEKYQALSGGVARQNAGDPKTGADVSYIISTQLEDLAPEEIDTVAFALVAANTRAELYQHAAAAALKYQQLINNRITNSPQIELEKAVVLYPNPSGGQVILQLPAELQRSSTTVQVIDMQGKLIISFNQVNAQNMPLPLPQHLTSGIYFVRVMTKNGTVVKKLVLQK